jgi:hypothetical protein
MSKSKSVPPADAPAINPTLEALDHLEATLAAVDAEQQAVEDEIATLQVEIGNTPQARLSRAQARQRGLAHSGPDRIRAARDAVLSAWPELRQLRSAIVAAHEQAHVLTSTGDDLAKRKAGRRVVELSALLKKLDSPDCLRSLLGSPAQLDALRRQIPTREVQYV